MKNALTLWGNGSARSCRAQRLREPQDRLRAKGRLFPFCGLVATLLAAGGPLAADGPVPAVPSRLLADVNPRQALPTLARTGDAKYLGFTDKNQFLLVLDYSYIQGLGAVKWMTRAPARSSAPAPPTP